MLKRINLVIEVADETEIVTAYLTPGASHAFFLYEKTVNYSLVNATTKPGLYIERGDISISIGSTKRGDIAIHDLHEKLRNMTAYEFLDYHVIHGCDEIELIREEDV